VAYTGFIEEDGAGVRVKADISAELDMWLEADGTGIKVRTADANPVFPTEANTLLGSGVYGWAGEYTPSFDLYTWEVNRNTNMIASYVRQGYIYVTRGITRTGTLSSETVVNMNGWPVNFGEDPTTPWTHSDAVMNGVFQDVLEINVVVISPLDVGE
jgi:hypothetical protein